MTTLLLAAPDEPETSLRERSPAVDERAASAAASRTPLTAWACGLDSSDPVAREKCRDMNPELMVELL